MFFSLNYCTNNLLSFWSTTTDFSVTLLLTAVEAFLVFVSRSDFRHIDDSPPSPDGSL